MHVPAVQLTFARGGGQFGWQTIRTRQSPTLRGLCTAKLDFAHDLVIASIVLLYIPTCGSG